MLAADACVADAPRDATDRDTPAGTSGIDARGPLTYAGNRVMLATRRKPAGTLRIAVVGDSMSYGAGIPYRKAFGARLATHLNAAVPELWVECVSFGVSGACLHHAAGRALTHALPADPDIVLLAACCNDAFLLGPQPADLNVLGAQWRAFGPLIRRSLATFRDAVTARGGKAAVVYLDRLRQAGDVSVPDELAAACADTGLAFVDGSSTLVGYQPRDLTVSVADSSHLSGLAYDVIARHAAQAVLSQGWLQPSTGFADGAWIEAIEHGGEARTAAGLAGALAYGEALTLLDSKWMHRRNTKRHEFDARYVSARARLLARQRASVVRVAYSAVQERLRVAHPLVAIWKVEMWANELMAVTFALEHLVEAGAADGVLANLTHLDERDAPPVSLEGSLARWEDIGDRVATLQDALREASRLQEPFGLESRELDYLTLWLSRISQWAYAVEQCSMRLLQRLPCLAPPLDEHGARLLAYIDKRADGVQAKLAELNEVAAEITAAGRDAARAAGAGYVMLELVMSTPPGPESWTFTVGMESIAPAFSERQVGTGYFIRDGQPHTYLIDLPVALSGNLHLYLEGLGLKAQGGGVRFHRAQLRWPQPELAAVALPAPIIEASSDSSAALVFRAVRTLP